MNAASSKAALSSISPAITRNSAARSGSASAFLRHPDLRLILLPVHFGVKFPNELRDQLRRHELIFEGVEDEPFE